MTRISTALLVLVVLSAQTVTQTPTKSPEGSWQGTLDAGQKLRLELTISKKADGTYSGNVNSIDQAAVIAIDVITVRNEVVRFP